MWFESTYGAICSKKKFFWAPNHAIFSQSSLILVVTDVVSKLAVKRGIL
jgi:hypothetical protein